MPVHEFRVGARLRLWGCQYVIEEISPEGQIRLLDLANKQTSATNAVALVMALLAGQIGKRRRAGRGSPLRSESKNLQISHRKLDLSAANADRKEQNRPWILMIQDQMSRMLIGFAIVEKDKLIVSLSVGKGGANAGKKDYQ